MAFPPHALVQLVGHFNTTDLADEVWSCGIRVSTHDPSGGYLANPQTYCDAVAPNIATWFHSGAIFDSRATLTMIKCNNIKPDGHYKDLVTHQTAVSTNGGAAGILPLFVSLAATLETGNTTGRARRGRVYLPTAAALGPAAGVTTDDATMNATRDKVKALLTILLINEPTGGLLVNPIIASKVDGSYNDITGVSVNNVFDVQRRRKNRASGHRSTVTAFP